MSNISRAKQKKIKDWLKKAGNDPVRVDKLKIETDADFRASILELHGVAQQEFDANTKARKVIP